MLRGDSKLAADVMPDQLGQKGLVFVCQNIVKADAGTDKDFHLHQEQPSAFSVAGRSRGGLLSGSDTALETGTVFGDRLPF